MLSCSLLSLCLSLSRKKIDQCAEAQCGQCANCNDITGECDFTPDEACDDANSETVQDKCNGDLGLCEGISKNINKNNQQKNNFIVPFCFFFWVGAIVGLEQINFHNCFNKNYFFCEKILFAGYIISVYIYMPVYIQ